VLVGTVSIEKSESFSERAEERKNPASRCSTPAITSRSAYHRAGGQPGRVTIATNMAGRGTDIMLGGNPDMLIEAASKDIKTNAPLKAKIAVAAIARK
jgi:preprotein translocase subunit SecA